VDKKVRTKIVQLIALLLLLTTSTIVMWDKFSHYRLEVSQKISKDVAVQTATSYLKIPTNTPIKSINLVKTPVTKNENAWEVILDYRVPNTKLLDRCRVYINSQTGEVLDYAVAGCIAED
jgi:hypothetical protein